MSLTRSEVEKIAHLARLEVSESEFPAYVDNLSKILDFVAQLEACDTKDIEPMAHPLRTTQRLRPDRVSEQDQREKFQQNAPSVESGLYLVPKVID